jgi:hypothetical protein
MLSGELPSNHLSGKVSPTEHVANALGIAHGKSLRTKQGTKRSIPQPHSTHRNLVSHGTRGRKSIEHFLTAA